MAKVEPKHPKAAKVECDICGAEISESYLPGHKRARHNVFGGKTGKPRARRNLPTPVAKRSVGRPRKTVNGSLGDGMFQRLPYVLIVDGEGELWIAEKLGRKA